MLARVQNGRVIAGSRLGCVFVSDKAVVCLLLLGLAAASLPLQVFYFCKEGASCRVTTALLEVAVTVSATDFPKSESTPESNAVERTGFNDTRRLDFGAGSMRIVSGLRRGSDRTVVPRS